MSDYSGALEAVDRIVNRESEADEVLRQTVEVLHDRALALPPIDATGARRIIDRLAVRPILDGVRGAEPADVDALANAVARLSALANDLGDLIAALDVNPVIVGSKGCVAVDALVELPRD